MIKPVLSNLIKILKPNLIKTIFALSNLTTFYKSNLIKTLYPKALNLASISQGVTKC
ncbi:MAG: hypothetical protein K5978_04700 [Campylobacter sp.]|nr:hypothetical protein [Campylobacter sp.]